jgi:hypothetical protein
MKPGTTDLTLEFTDEEYALACKLAGERNITVEELIRDILEINFSTKPPNNDLRD